MNRPIVLVLSALTFASATGCKKREAKPPAKVANEAKAGLATASLAADGLPAGEPERAIVLGQCQICHTSEYVLQQRLTPAQWSKTVKKMIGWGAPISETQGEALAKVLGALYPAERADAVPPLVDNPGIEK